MVIGEAPGEVEDSEDMVFWGDSGQLLMSMIEKAWPPLGWEDVRGKKKPILDPRIEALRAIDDDNAYFTALRDFLDDYIFWTNLVLCHPEKNRDPQKSEIKECSDRLHRTIYAVDPRLIITTGKLAASAFLKKDVAITEKHGSLFDVSIPSPVTGDPVRYTMLALLHPAYLLRQGDKDLVKREQGKTYETIEDLREGLRLLDLTYKLAYDKDLTETP
jgi:uracil-DNA glycosylase family 4